MTAFRHTTLTKTDEVFDGKDRAEIGAIITDLRRSYIERLQEAEVEYHSAERRVNRASHEVTRLKRHLERIDAFCTTNNIITEEK